MKYDRIIVPKNNCDLIKLSKETVRKQSSMEEVHKYTNHGITNNGTI